ncbi:GMC family oxidoreductase [Streptomyces sp. NPDC017056]|uniref:GMC family oxidoreductase n=1 Tax=Streptomyces sp. NPDC017056 TaxID=3364973 RepID=UPI0037AD0D32
MMSGNAETGITGADTRGAGPFAGRVPERAGIVVVGGGLAGLELAGELAGHGVGDVLVLEAGPGDDLAHIHLEQDQDAATELVFAPDRDPCFRRTWVSDAAPHYTGISGLRRRLGGRSLYWHGVILPLEDWALRDWPSDVAGALTAGWCGGPSLYKRVTADLMSWSAGTDGTPPAPDERTVECGGLAFRPLPRACRYVPDEASGGVRWEAYTALDHWRTGAGRPAPPAGVRIRCRTEVLAVQVRGATARGVLVRDEDTGGVSAIAADTVVLCAGTVESTRLAIQALTEAGALREPRLGNLADHIVQGFTARLDGALGPLAARGLEPGSYYVPTSAATRSYLRMDLHRTASEGVLLDVRVTGEQLPNPDSVVECRPTGPAPWQARVRTALHAQDREMIGVQRAGLSAFWRDLSRELGLPPVPLEFEDFGDPARDNTLVLPGRTRTLSHGMPDTWTSLLGTEDHEGGSLPLGTVLTSRHECVGLAGLYAAGPVVFPRLGAANPSLTTLALSRRLAAILAGAHG